MVVTHFSTYANGRTRRSWGPDGNPVGKHDGANAWNYAFDPEDRLTAILLNGRDCSRFQYGANGRRVGLWGDASAW